MVAFPAVVLVAAMQSDGFLEVQVPSSKRLIRESLLIRFAS